MFERLLGRIRMADLLTFLLFLVLAAVIWYGHAMQSVRDTRVPVLIQYTGKPNQIGLSGKGLPDTIMVDIRDAGKRLNTYIKKPLYLTIDIHPYIHGTKGNIHIPSDVIRRSIGDILQGTTHLIGVYPNEITCAYFTEKERTIPVAAHCNLHLAPEYQLVGKPILNHSTVKIYGKENALQAIDSIYTQYTILHNLIDTTNVRVALVIPNGLRCNIDSVNMCIIAERYTEKKITIPLEVRGVPEGYKIRLFPNQVDVSVRIGMNHFSKITAKDIRAVCYYSADRKDKLVVELEYSHSRITAAWAYPSVVEFLLEQ